MRWFVLSLNLLLVGCEVKFGETTTTPGAAVNTISETEKIVTAMQGTYSGCVPSPVYGGYFNKVEIVVANNTIDYYFELSGNAACTSPYYRNRFQYEIDKAAYVTAGNEEDINLDLKMKFMKITWNINGYVNAHYCGLNDWVLFQEKDVTGLACLDLISTYDTHHSSFKNVDDFEYIKIKLKTNSFTISIGVDESGDTVNDRKSTKQAEIPKI